MVSLRQLDNGYWTVRVLDRRLMVKRRWKYCAAMAINCVLRVTWILSAVPMPPGYDAIHAEIWMTVYAALEVTRRCMWSYFRVENEHTTNAGMFRATLEVGS